MATPKHHGQKMRFHLRCFIQNNLSQPIKDIVGEAFLGNHSRGTWNVPIHRGNRNSNNINAFILKEKVTEKFEEALFPGRVNWPLASEAVLEASLGGLTLRIIRRLNIAFGRVKTITFHTVNLTSQYG